MRTFISTLLLSLWFTTTALANDTSLTANQWMVQLPSGDVQIGLATESSGYRWQAAQQGQRVVAPFLVKTGATGQAVISRGNDSMQVAPDSLFEVTAASQSDASLVTRILQQLGTLIYRVETLPEKRFEVETTYLVSVAKGTTFTIDVSPDKATVSLTEGSLDVSTADGAHRVLLVPGEIAEQFRDIRGIAVSRPDFSSNWGPWNPLPAPADRSRQAGSQKAAAETRIPNQIRHRPRAVNATDGHPDTNSGIRRGGPMQQFEPGDHPGEYADAPGRFSHHSEFSLPDDSDSKAMLDNMVDFNDAGTFEKFDDLDRDIDLDDVDFDDIKELADMLEDSKDQDVR